MIRPVAIRPSMMPLRRNRHASASCVGYAPFALPRKQKKRTEAIKPPSLHRSSLAAVYAALRLRPAFAAGARSTSRLPGCRIGSAPVCSACGATTRSIWITLPSFTGRGASSVMNGLAAATRFRSRVIRRSVHSGNSALIASQTRSVSSTTCSTVASDRASASVALSLTP